MNFAITGGGGKRLKIQFRIGWNNRHADAVPIALCNQRFEKLFRWQSDLGRNRLSGEVVWIHFVFPQFISDSHLIQEAGSVSFLGHCKISRVSGPTPWSATTSVCPVSLRLIVW